MYEEYFGLRYKPFQLTPDPDVFFESSAHSKAYSYLQYGLTQGEGFIVITGGVGTGKTTIANHLVADLDDENIIAKQLVTPNLNPDDLISAITQLFNLHPENGTKAAHISELTHYMERISALGKRLLLLIDEAQNLPLESIEELRMLSNIQVDGKAIIQSFLLGQNELDVILTAPEMEQFRQRVIASASVTPLNPEELEHYIDYRLSKAGWTGESPFQAGAIDMVHSFTNGVPRKINTFLDRVFLYCYLEEIKIISVDAINEVIKEVSTELNHKQADGNLSATITNRFSNKHEAEVPVPQSQIETPDSKIRQGAIETAELLGMDMSSVAMEKTETLLDSILTMTRRSLLVQSQILKELKEIKEQGNK